MSNVVHLPFLDLDRRGRGRFLTAAAAPTWAALFVSARTIKIEKQKSGGLEKCVEVLHLVKHLHTSRVYYYYYLCVWCVCVCVFVCVCVYTFARFHYRSSGGPCVGDELVVGAEDKLNHKRKSNTSFSCG